MAEVLPSAGPRASPTAWTPMRRATGFATTSTAMGSGILPTQYGVPVLRVIKLVGEEAVRLADALDAIDAATDANVKSTAVSRARAIVAGMSALVANSTVPIPDEKARAMVVSILATFQSILQQFGDSIMTLVGGRVAVDLRTTSNEWRTTWALHYSPSF